MSQVDKFFYLPVLFWFLLLCIIFYIFIFSWIVPLFFSAFFSRVFLFRSFAGFILNILKYFVFFYECFTGLFFFLLILGVEGVV